MLSVSFVERPQDAAVLMFDYVLTAVVSNRVGNENRRNGRWLFQDLHAKDFERVKDDPNGLAVCVENRQFEYVVATPKLHLVREFSYGIKLFRRFVMPLDRERERNARVDYWRQRVILKHKKTAGPEGPAVFVQ